MRKGRREGRRRGKERRKMEVRGGRDGRSEKPDGRGERSA